MGGATPVMPQPAHPGLLALAQLAFNYFTYAVMLFAVPLVLFSNLGIVEAVRDALRASVRNVGANLVAAGLFAAGTLVAAIVILLISHRCSAGSAAWCIPQWARCWRRCPCSPSPRRCW